LRKGLVVRVDALDQDLVRPRRKTVDDKRLAARVRPALGRIIHGHMDVPVTTRPWTSESASGGSTTIRAAGSLASGTTGAGPRMSLAVCATAVDAHRTAAAPIRPMNACLMPVLPGRW